MNNVKHLVIKHNINKEKFYVIYKDIEDYIKINLENKIDNLNLKKVININYLLIHVYIVQIENMVYQI